MIHLIGPGGAGKTTTGMALATRLSVPFVDLDERFTATVGDVSPFITIQGYGAYASANVGVYLALINATPTNAVVALSSGFMTYPENAHPRYRELRQRIASHHDTFVLLPSLEKEACVAEIVRRQLTRPLVVPPCLALERSLPTSHP